MERKLSRLAIVCGGTGGHFHPGLSVARALRARGGEARLFLEAGRVGKQAATAASRDVKAAEIVSAQLPGNPFAAVRFAARTTWGFMEAYGALREFRPDAVLGMGSFTSAPVCAAALLMKIPLFLHDGNARIGKANRFFSRWAKTLMTAFPAVNADAVSCPVEWSGMPLRPELLEKHWDKKAAITELNTTYVAGLSPTLPTILIFGGSQGARAVNQCAAAALVALKRTDFQVIHLTGKGKLEEAVTAGGDKGYRCLELESLEDMALMYGAADIAVCRSGGSTVAELAVFGKYATLFPYPYASERHQDDNAAFYAASGAAEIISDGNDAIPRLTAALTDWLNNPKAYERLGEKGKTLAIPDAADRVLERVEKYLNEERRPR